MKIDMTPIAVTLRLRQASQLRQACLVLAKSSTGLRIQRRYAANHLVQRTSLALGHDKGWGSGINK
jgi:hypothetical protein